MIRTILLFFTVPCLNGLCLCQTGLESILKTMTNERHVHDSQIDWALIHRSCPSNTVWTLHLTPYQLSQPLDHGSFESNQFESSLYAPYFPKRFMKKSRLWVSSLVFDGNNKLIGSWEMRLTTADCNTSEWIRMDKELLAQVYHDSVPRALGVIHWRYLDGYVYKTSNGWYIISYKDGILRHEPFLTLLREHWNELVADGQYARGPWLDE